MRRILVLLSVIALVAPAAAEPQPRRTAPKPAPKSAPKTAPNSDRPKVVRPSRDPCAEFGPGFTRAPGSDTCVHFGGGIGVGVGVGVGTPGTIGH